MLTAGLEGRACGPAAAMAAVAAAAEESGFTAGVCDLLVCFTVQNTTALFKCLDEGFAVLQ